MTGRFFEATAATPQREEGCPCLQSPPPNAWEREVKGRWTAVPALVEGCQAVPPDYEGVGA